MTGAAAPAANADTGPRDSARSTRSRGGDRDSRPWRAALCIAFSGIFYLWADVTPSTGTVFRALFGLPLLAAVALAERRRYGPLPRRAVRLAVVAGVFFAVT